MPHLWQWSITVALPPHGSLFLGGNRQGCPLPPMLFVVSLEPLDQLIHQSPDIKELWIAGIHNKISLFADNILLSLSSPHVTLSCLLRVFNAFGALSRMKVNQPKSKARNIPHPNYCAASGSCQSWSQAKYTALSKIRS